MSRGARHLSRLLVALERGKPLPAEIADWLREGARHYLDEGGACDLETALGLRGPGVRSVWTCLAMEARTVALLAALEHCALPGGRDSTWRRCQVLAQAIRRFERRVWPAIREHREPPPFLSPLEQAIFRAVASGGTVPRTARALYRLLTRTPPGFLSVERCGTLRP